MIDRVIGRFYGKILERFQNLRALWVVAKGGIYSHPTDQDLSVWTPVEENATQLRWFPYTAILEPLSAAGA
jgi:hypothetical protein